MQGLGVAVAIFAGIAGLVGWQLQGALIGLLAVAALGQALTLWLSPKMSSFLKIFSYIFGAETLVFGAIYLLNKLGWWPKALQAYLIPESLPLTVALFGILIFAISFIKVVGEITRIADPYFDTQEVTTARQWPIPAFRLRLCVLATGMVVFLVLINQAEVAIDVRLSFFSRDWFNAIQTKNEPEFWKQLLWVFLPWALIYVAAIVIEFVVTSIFVVRWRRFLTDRFTRRWLDQGAHYRMALTGSNTDNPDQRIQEDINTFIFGAGSDAGSGNGIVGYSVNLLSKITSLVTFAIVLWGLSNNFMLPGTTIVVPGLLFWVALIYAGLGTWTAHLIGRALVGLYFLQQRFEANFRFALSRLREYSEQIALLGGERNERASIMSRFGKVFDNYLNIVGFRKKLRAFVSFYGQISPIIPYIFTAPFYFSGKIQLGIMTQTARAFGSVQESLNFFITYYTSLADFRAVLDRLTSFDAAIDVANSALTAQPHVLHRSNAQARFQLSDLSLTIPGGPVIVTTDDLTFHAGQATLLVGPSGSGKSTLLRAISGIWPYGSGTIDVPVGAHLLLLPQRPYIPIGPLRDAVTYPATLGTYSDSAMRGALVSALLPDLAEQLDVDDNWSQRLSGGEQQRLAIARALLIRPGWLFLDEATAALDETSEAAIYKALARELPDTTIVSIGHRATLNAFHQRRIEMVPVGHGAHSPADVSLKAAE